MSVRISLILTLIFYAPVRSLSQIKHPPVPQQNNYQPIGTPLKVNRWPISSNNSIKAGNIDSFIAKKQEEIATLLQSTREQDNRYRVAHTEKVIRMDARSVKQPFLINWKIIKRLVMIRSR
jgi:hypothetical protein